MKKESSLAGLTDRTPRYTVKQMAEKMGLTTYAVRYYDNAGLIPECQAKTLRAIQPIAGLA